MYGNQLNIGGAMNIGSSLGDGLRNCAPIYAEPCAGMDKTPFAIAVDGNHSAMGQLHNLLTHLEARMAPLMSEGNKGRPSEASSEPCSISQIVGQIESNTRGLYMACERIQTLLDRLTV